MEEVLVVPREKLKGYLPQRNLCRDLVGEVLAIADREGEYRPREEVETNPGLKQLIPYTFFTCDGQVFTYRRLTGGGESRLHNLISIGVGGHVTRHHDDPEVNWFMNVAREMHEELHLELPYTLNPYGILNEDITDVCKVHLGVVYEARVERTDAVSIKERHELEGAWHPFGELENLYSYMEVWSKILFEQLKGA